MNVFDVSMKQIRNGLVYLPNETKPFTGGFVGWYPNGQKKEEVNYIDGLAVGTRTVWIEQYYKDGKEDGQRLTWWYRNGKKESETNYKDGKKDGNSILWFKNGQKKKESNYIDGKEDGKYTQWYENGTKAEESNYIDGKLDGKYTRWIDNGLKYTGSNYIDGKKTSFIVMRLKKIGINPKKWYFVIFTVVIIFFLN